LLKTLVKSDVALPQKQNAIFIEGHTAGTQLFSIDAVLLSSRINSADQSNSLNFNKVSDNSDKVCHSFSTPSVFLSSCFDSANQSNALNFVAVRDNSDKVCHFFSIPSGFLSCRFDSANQSNALNFISVQHNSGKVWRHKFVENTCQIGCCFAPKTKCDLNWRLQCWNTIVFHWCSIVV